MAYRVVPPVLPRPTYLVGPYCHGQPKIDLGKNPLRALRPEVLYFSSPSRRTAACVHDGRTATHVQVVTEVKKSGQDALNHATGSSGSLRRSYPLVGLPSMMVQNAFAGPSCCGGTNTSFSCSNSFGSLAPVSSRMECSAEKERAFAQAPMIHAS